MRQQRTGKKQIIIFVFLAPKFWEIQVKPSKKGKKKGKEEGAEEAAEDEAVPAPEVEVGEDGVSRPVSARPEIAEAVLVETGKERKRSKLAICKFFCHVGYWRHFEKESKQT